MQPLDLLRAEPGNAHELDDPLGQVRAELLEVAGFAGLDEVRDHAEGRGPDAPDLRELSGFDQGGEVVGVEGEDGLRRPAIRARLESVLGSKLEERGDLGQDVGRGAGIHCGRSRRRS